MKGLYSEALEMFVSASVYFCVIENEWKGKGKRKGWGLTVIAMTTDNRWEKLTDKQMGNGQCNKVIKKEPLEKEM